MPKIKKLQNAEIEKPQIYRIENTKVDVRISTLYILADSVKTDIKEYLKQ